MSEANKSLMLSEAEIIEAINSDSLISVSLGAGQPQKNVKMSTLATVAAELLQLGNVFMKMGNISQVDIAEGSSKITAVGMYYVVGTANDGNLVNDWGTVVIFKPVAGRYTLLKFGYNCGKIGYAMHNGSTWGGLIEL